MTIYVHPGRKYQRLEDGRIVEGHGPEAPDVRVCRRLEDYADGVPAGGALGWCGGCGRPIVWTPADQVPADLPRLCLQCVGIEPLPIEANP